MIKAAQAANKMTVRFVTVCGKFDSYTAQKQSGTQTQENLHKSKQTTMFALRMFSFLFHTY